MTREALSDVSLDELFEEIELRLGRLLKSLTHKDDRVRELREMIGAAPGAPPHRRAARKPKARPARQAAHAPAPRSARSRPRAAARKPRPAAAHKVTIDDFVASPAGPEAPDITLPDWLNRTFTEMGLEVRKVPPPDEAAKAAHRRRGAATGEVTVPEWLEDTFAVGAAEAPVPPKPKPSRRRRPPASEHRTPAARRRAWRQAGAAPAPATTEGPATEPIPPAEPEETASETPAAQAPKAGTHLARPRRQAGAGRPSARRLTAKHPHAGARPTHEDRTHEPTIIIRPAPPSPRVLISQPPPQQVLKAPSPDEPAEDALESQSQTAVAEAAPQAALEEQAQAATAEEQIATMEPATPAPPPEPPTAIQTITPAGPPPTPRTRPAIIKRLNDLIRHVRPGNHAAHELTPAAPPEVEVTPIAIPPGLHRDLLLDAGSGVRMRLLLIPAGRFLMGSTEQERHAAHDAFIDMGISRPTAALWCQSETPQHEVVISHPFYMAEVAVTQEQYQAVMGENPSFFRGVTNPVERAAWQEAMEFCDRLSRRAQRRVLLPTEAQWEYACRAGSVTPFHTGDTIGTDQANFNGKRVFGAGLKGEHRQLTVPAKTFRPNAMGLYNMHGNVWEWCADWFDSSGYGKSRTVDPRGPGFGGRRVVRGGSWAVYPVFCRSAFRYGYTTDTRNYDIGFRVIVTVE